MSSSRILAVSFMYKKQKVIEVHRKVIAVICIPMKDSATDAGKTSLNQQEDSRTKKSQSGPVSSTSDRTMVVSVVVCKRRTRILSFRYVYV